MWRAVSSWTDESDPDSVVWHVLAERDDGHIQTVYVKMEKIRVPEYRGAGEGPAFHAVKKVIETQGKSLVEANPSELLPPMFVFGKGGFVAEWD